ncbi:MAG TPA: hypothetical protein VKB84_17965 [Candidatus Binataceae bacterium]|nr:hypothetical protein [Candidatus Binataceae bacterium]
MKTRRLWKVCAQIVLACLMAAAAAAKERDLKLDQYVGKYPDRQFLALPAVRDPLARLLGKRLGPFLDRFQVTTPIDRVARDIVAEGCVRHNCGAEQAAFSVDLDTGEVAAATLTEGKYINIYGGSTRSYRNLPPGLRRWISSRTSQDPHFKKLKLRFYS